MVFGEAPHDGHDLVGSLALTEHGFRHAVAERAVQVHSREAQIFDGQRAQAEKRLLRRHGAVRDSLEEGSYFFPVHFRISLALPLRKPWRSTVT